MALKLRVTSYGGQPMGAAAEHVFDDSGGSIGRAKDNDWCLPDPERVISNTHAFISCTNGEFYYRDNSTNGTSLNTLQLCKGDERPLRSGDYLKIGVYEISVESNGHEIEKPRDTSGRQEPSLSNLAPNLNVDPGATLDPLELLGTGSDHDSMNLPPEDFDFGAQADHSSPESMGFEPPAPIPDANPMPIANEAPSGIPENWDVTGMDSDESPLKPQPASSTPSVKVPVPQSPTATVSVPAAKMPPRTAGDRASGVADDGSGIAAMLVAAGIRPEAINTETYAMLGEILKVVIEGTVDVLSARAQISPVDAFHEGYEDIKAHQLAMIAGMRAAYEAMLEYFNPDDLEAEFDRALKRGVLGGVLNKTKYWDLYEDLYKSLAKDPDSSFHKLFGDEFARAYEDQMQRLLTVRKR